MDAWKKVNDIIAEMVSDPENAEYYWTQYHNQNNRNIKKHILSHSMLLAVAIRRRKGKEIIKQSWLGSAVIPVHIRDLIREKV